MKKEPKELTYKERVFKLLDEMQVGKLVLKKWCKPENKELFISTIKQFIDLGTRNGYDIVFNEQYTEIRKWDTILKTSLQEFKESL